MATLEQPLNSPSPAREPRPLTSSTPLLGLNHQLQSRNPQLLGDDEVDGYVGSLQSKPSYSDGLHPVLSSRGYHQVHTHRQKIVREIFDTEHSYISQLTTVVSLFLKPIRVGCLLPPNAITTVFSNIEAILSVNQELFSCMRQKSLGEAFSYLGPFLKLYSTYAEDYQDANEKLQEWLKKDTNFSSFVISQESRPECCGLRLASLLITPVQRVPRYKLLLEDLLKHTKVTHTEYAKLKAASVEIASVTSHINEHVRQHENFRKMLSIQRSLTGQGVPSILSPGRSFIHEGKLMKVCRTSRKPKERMVFLFSDLLIYAKPRDVQRCYEYRCALPLIHSNIEVLSKDERAPGVDSLLMVSNGDMSLLFYSHQQEEVARWAEIVRGTISELQQTYGSLMRPVPNSDLVTGGVNAQEDVSSQSLTMSTPYPLTATLFSLRSFTDPPPQDNDTTRVFGYDQESVLPQRQSNPHTDSHTHTSPSSPRQNSLKDNSNDPLQKQTTVDSNQQSAESSQRPPMLVDEDEAILQLVQGNCSVENGAGQYRQGATQVEEEVNNEMVDTDTTSEKENGQRSTRDVEGTTQSLPGPPNPLKSVRSLSTIYSMENEYLGSKCCAIL